MGKVRRLRKKFHLACQKAQPEKETPSVVPVVLSVPGQTEVPVKLNSDSNIFAGITISLSDLKQTLLPPPTQLLGTVNETPVAESQADQATSQSSVKHVSKKEKRFARREALLRKIDTVRQLKLEAKKKKKNDKKKEAAKPMLMKSLFDALPLITANSDPKGPGKRASKNPHVKACLPKKKRKKQFMDNLKTFKSVLSNSHYKADPTSAISSYLLQTVSKKSTGSQP